MWVLILVASVGFKTINSSQILGTGIQNNHNYNKTSICEFVVSLKCNSDAMPMREYLQMNVNNSSAPDLEKGGNETSSGWHKIGVWGLQSLGGGIVSNLYFWVLIGISSQTELYSYQHVWSFSTQRAIGDVLLTAPVVWGIGKLLGEKGSLWKAMVGAGISSLLSTALWLTIPEGNKYIGCVYIGSCIIPTFAAIIGYNLR